ncbi:hypothetical protein MC885_005488 [Smutsia gigantea]|nr:hypothetical protein MC885_005488 [Smutsia gigantea]
MITRAPKRSSSAAVARPRPLFAPVIRTVFPCMRPESPPPGSLCTLNRRAASHRAPPNAANSAAMVATAMAAGAESPRPLRATSGVAALRERRTPPVRTELWGAACGPRRGDAGHAGTCSFLPSTLIGWGSTSLWVAVPRWSRLPAREDGWDYVRVYGLQIEECIDNSRYMSCDSAEFLCPSNVEHVVIEEHVGPYFHQDGIFGGSIKEKLHLSLDPSGKGFSAHGLLNWLHSWLKSESLSRDPAKGTYVTAVIYCAKGTEC